MPIWLTVNTPQPQYLHYPGSEVATDFGCVEIEVQHDGNVIPPLKLPGPSVGAGVVCGTIAGDDGPAARFPLHLRYPKLEAGTYNVRYRRFYPDFQSRQNVVLELSGWTALKVERATGEQIESWLTALLAHVPDSPGMLLGDFLPSLLASRTERALAAMLNQTYNKNDAVAHYATNNLSLFDPKLVRRILLSTIHERGTGYAFADRLSSIREIAKPIANELAKEAARFIGSDDPKKLAGAMHTARMISFFTLDEQTRRELSRAQQISVERVLVQRNERAASDLVQFLSQAKTPEAHDQIWRFVSAHLAEEQSLICITWVKDPSDLPRLAAILSTYDDSDPNGSRRAAVFYGMKGYGAAAHPYFRDILSDSRQAFVRTSAAQELALMNDPAGWQFFRKTIDERPFYHNEMIRWFKDNFPEIKNADESAISAFVDRKINGN
jgi:hypothetical protein